MQVCEKYKLLLIKITTYCLGVKFSSRAEQHLLILVLIIIDICLLLIAKVTKEQFGIKLQHAHFNGCFIY